MYAASWTTAAARPVRPGDGVLEDAVGHTDGAGIRGIVEIQRCRGWRGGEVGRPAPLGTKRHRLEARSRERRAGRVVRVVRVGQEQRVALVAEAERELDDGGLRARDQRHLGLGIELDAVDVAVAARDRLLRLRQAADRRIAVDRRVEHGLPQSLDDVRRRPRLRVSPPEIDERLAVCGGGGRDPAEEPDEVLLRQPIQALGARTHSGIVLGGRRAVGDAVHRRSPAVRRRVR